MSNHAMHEVVGDICENIDVLAVAPSAEEVKQKIREAGRGKKRRPIMVPAMDGTHVPTRPDEAKGKRRGWKRVRAKRATWEGEWKQRVRVLSRGWRKDRAYSKLTGLLSPE